MRRFFGKIEDDFAVIEGEEFAHLKNVLRMKEGDQIVVYNKSEIEFLCKIKELKKDFALAKIEKQNICPALPKKNIILFQAVTKRDNFELIVQKAVELGVKRFVPFLSEYCSAKEFVNKKERIEKIVLGACKQCECSVPMIVENVVSFDDMLRCASKHNLLLFANEREGDNFDFLSLKNAEDIAIIVGPEGGFSEIEKEKILEINSKSVSLGKRILRSETASIVLVGMVSILSGN